MEIFIYKFIFHVALIFVNVSFPCTMRLIKCTLCFLYYASNEGELPNATCQFANSP